MVSPHLLLSAPRFNLSGLLVAQLLVAMGCGDDPNLSHGADAAAPRAGQGTPTQPVYELELDGRTAILELAPNDSMFSDDYREYIATDAGLEEIPNAKARRPTCMYRGSAAWADGVKSTGPSWSALNTCDGFQGLIALDGETWIVAPGSSDDEVLVSRMSAGIDAPVARASIRLSTRPQSALQEHTEALVPPMKYLELVVVSDAARFEELGMDAPADAVQIANLADAIYRNGMLSPSIAIVVTGNVVIPGGTDPWQVPVSGGEVDPQVLLTNFASWARTHLVPIPADEHFLLTQRDLLGSTIGLAYLSAVCSTNKQGLLQSTLTQAQSGTTLAHELGHSLGMQHDGSACFGNYIMNASVSVPPSTTWSSCSQTSLTNFLPSLGSPGCLANIPAPDTSAPDCGDGILDPGEQCDCGSTLCTGFDPCCNGSTCQLIAGASCSALDGCCTSSCQLKPQGTTCEADTACTPAAICSGSNSVCPAPAPISNGSACSVAGYNDGACFQGKCESRSQQCAGVLPDLVSCGTGTDCDVLSCQNAQYGCVEWLVDAVDGTRCGSGRQCDQGSCVPTATLPLCPHDQPTNACGGCSSLATAPGGVCNTCGVLSCVSPSEVKCSVASSSACAHPAAVPTGIPPVLLALALLASGVLFLRRRRQDLSGTSAQAMAAS